MLSLKFLAGIALSISLLGCSNEEPVLLKAVVYYNDSDFIPFSGSTEDWVRSGDSCVVTDERALEILGKEKLHNLVRQESIRLNYVGVVCDLYWDNKNIDKLFMNFFVLEYKGQLYEHDKELANLLFESCCLQSRYDYDREMYNW